MEMAEGDRVGVSWVMSWVFSPPSLSGGELGDELGAEPSGFERCGLSWVMSWVKSPRGLSWGELGDELGDEPSGSECG